MKLAPNMENECRQAAPRIIDHHAGRRLDQAAKAIQAAPHAPAALHGRYVAVPVGGIADPLVEALCEKAAKMSVGPTDGDAKVDMGPVTQRTSGESERLARRWKSEVRVFR